MCGISGFWQPQGRLAAGGKSSLIAMRDATSYRGPDEADTWIDPEVGIALAHRRLSILDLSSGGSQPMESLSGRYQIVFNGEIYNHMTLRAGVEASGLTHWKGHSDTESLLTSIEVFGLEETLLRASGMFAFALWDRQKKVLTLARDRIGEKPLYYGWNTGMFLFASELKSIASHPNFKKEVEVSVLPHYLRTGYIPAPLSVWKGIFKLLPGTYLSISSATFDKAEPVAYWDFQQVAQRQMRLGFEGSFNEAVDQLDEILGSAISHQMIADVPLGAFLSGGIDSSTVAALMQAQASKPIKTFSIGFTNHDFNEAHYAKQVANHLGTDHTELYLEIDQAREVVPFIPDMFSEPFGDPSAIPTYFVAKLAREHVTVSLSGDGGDELYGGYSRYFNTHSERLWRCLQHLPSAVSNGLAKGLNSSLALQAYKFAGSQATRLAAGAEAISDYAQCPDFNAYYQRLTSQWNPRPLVNPIHMQDLQRLADVGIMGLDHLHHMMAVDTLTYLPDDILAKVDRTAMCNSLETRVPLLDQTCVEFAWRLPYNFKVREGKGKWILRKLLHRYVPEALVERPKKGFGVPVDTWLRGPLRDWAEDLISVERIDTIGFLDAAAVRRRWEQHLNRERNWSHSLWVVLMWQAWASKNL